MREHTIPKTVKGGGKKIGKPETSYNPKTRSGPARRGRKCNEKTYKRGCRPNHGWRNPNTAHPNLKVAVQWDLNGK